MWVFWLVCVGVGICVVGWCSGKWGGGLYGWTLPVGGLSISGLGGKRLCCNSRVVGLGVCGGLVGLRPFWGPLGHLALVWVVKMQGMWWWEAVSAMDLVAGLGVGRLLASVGGVLQGLHSAMDFGGLDWVLAG